MYPALAILTARCLERWRSSPATFPRWIMPATVGGLVIVGIVTVVGLALAGGLLPLTGVKMRTFPGLENWLWLGFIPLVGAGIAGFYLRHQQRGHFVGSLVLTSVFFVALIAAFPAIAFDQYKAPRQLVEQADLRQPHRDIRLLALYWFQPSVVFYSRREVEKMENWPEALKYLAMRHPVYLFVPEPVWSKVQQENPNATAYRTVARQFDFLKNCDILVVTNQ